MEFQHARDDDDRAEFDPWPARHRHHHGHHNQAIQGGVSSRAAVAIAVAVICFIVGADLVLFAMSLHP